LKLEVKTSYVHIEHVFIVLGRRRLNWLERPDAGIQQNSVETGHIFFDLFTQRLCGG
jgi:hypothetical protein